MKKRIGLYEARQRLAVAKTESERKNWQRVIRLRSAQGGKKIADKHAVASN